MWMMPLHLHGDYQKSDYDDDECKLFNFTGTFINFFTVGAFKWCSKVFPIGILGKVWYLIVSIPDLCTLTYFVNRIHQITHTETIIVLAWPDIFTSKLDFLGKVKGHGVRFTGKWPPLLK